MLHKLKYIVRVSLVLKKNIIMRFVYNFYKKIQKKVLRMGLEPTTFCS